MYVEPTPVFIEKNNIALDIGDLDLPPPPEALDTPPGGLREEAAAEAFDVDEATATAGLSAPMWLSRKRRHTPPPHPSYGVFDSRLELTHAELQRWVEREAYIANYQNDHVGPPGEHVGDGVRDIVSGDSPTELSPSVSSFSKTTPGWPPENKVTSRLPTAVASALGRVGVYSRRVVAVGVLKFAKPRGAVVAGGDRRVLSVVSPFGWGTGGRVTLGWRRWGT